MHRRPIKLRGFAKAEFAKLYNLKSISDRLNNLNKESVHNQT